MRVFFLAGALRRAMRQSGRVLHTPSREGGEEQGTDLGLDVAVEDLMVVKVRETPEDVPSVVAGGGDLEDAELARGPGGRVGGDGWLLV